MSSGLPMNKKIDRWEVKLGIAQVIILLGVVTGCMTLAFYLGFFSGKQAGFELAMDSNAASSVKIPIASGHTDDSATAMQKTEQAVTDVYARLNEKAKEAKAALEKPEDMPELSTIKETVTDAPLEPSVPKKDAQELGDPWAHKPALHGTEIPKVLGDEVPNVNPETKVARNNAAAALFEDHEEPAGKSKEVLPAIAENRKPVEEKKVEVDARKIEGKTTPDKKVEAKKTPEIKVELARKEEPQNPVPAKVAESPGIARGKVASGWYAQIAAPTKKEEADAIALKLQKNGFHVAIENAEVRGDKYYRILVGPEKNKTQADALVGQLKRESYVGGAPFIRMIK